MKNNDKYYFYDNFKVRPCPIFRTVEDFGLRKCPLKHLCERKDRGNYPKICD
jgi:hypothetical protein